MVRSARRLEIGTLDGWLWDAACQIRGALDAPSFKAHILPLVSLILRHELTIGKRRVVGIPLPEVAGDT